MKKKGNSLFVLVISVVFLLVGCGDSKVSEEIAVTSPEANNSVIEEDNTVSIEESVVEAPAVIVERTKHELRKITVDGDVPSADEYDECTVKLTESNYSDYFEISTTINDAGDICVFLKSNVFDKGWVYYEEDNFYLKYSESYGTSVPYSVLSYPTFMTQENYNEFLKDAQVLEIKGSLTFRSINSMDNCVIDDGKRNVDFGDMSESSVGEGIFKDFPY